MAILCQSGPAHKNPLFQSVRQVVDQVVGQGPVTVPVLSQVSRCGDATQDVLPRRCGVVGALVAAAALLDGSGQDQALQECMQVMIRDPGPCPQHRGGGAWPVVDPQEHLDAVRSDIIHEAA